MTCPPEIARPIAEILKAAVLTIRAAGWSGQAARCAAEADHVHNLPALLLDYSSEALRYYLEVEAPAFARNAGPAGAALFEQWWAELRAAALTPSRGPR